MLAPKGLKRHQPFRVASAPIDPYVSAYLTALGVANDTTTYWAAPYQLTGAAIYTAFNNWMAAIKAVGVDLLAVKWFLPQYGTTLAQMAINFWNPGGANDATYNGGFTYDAGGIQGNGINNYATAGIVPNLFFTANDTTMGFYSRTNILGTEYDMGCRSNLGFPNDMAIAAYYVPLLTANSRQYTYPGIVPANPDTLGDHLATRVNSTDLRFFKNGAQLGATFTTANTDPLPGLFQLYLTAFNNGGSATVNSTKKFAGMYLYSGMTPTQAVAYQNANIALNTALLRP